MPGGGPRRRASNVEESRLFYLGYVLITHDAEIAAAAPRTVRMEDGRVVGGARSLQAAPV